MKVNKREPSGKMKAANDRREVFMTQNAKTTFWKEIKRDWN